MIFLGNELLDLADQLGILDEQGVGGEDGAVLLAELFADRVLIGAGIGNGLLQGLMQPIDFIRWPGFVDELARNANAFGLDDQGLADGDARRNGNAAFDFHRWFRWWRDAREMSAV